MTRGERRLYDYWARRRPKAEDDSDGGANTVAWGPQHRWLVFSTCGERRYWTAIEPRRLRMVRVDGRGLRDLGPRESPAWRDAEPPLVQWQAGSTSAMGITGDIGLAVDRIVIGKHSFALTWRRDLDAATMAGSEQVTGGASVAGASLYRVDVPASVTLRHGNTLCGAAAVTRLLVIDRGRQGGAAAGLGLVFLQGDAEPWAAGWQKTAGVVCGSFEYFRR